MGYVPDYRPSLIFPVLLFLFFATSVQAVDSDLSRKTLTGLRSFYVVVEDFHEGMGPYEQPLRNAGLAKQQIRERVEKQLRDAGIRVVSNQEWMGTPGRPILYINVNMHEKERYAFAYNSGISVEQLVRLDTNPSVKTVASTWSLSITGNVDIGSLNIVKESIRILVDRFIRAYREAGAKR